MQVKIFAVIAVFPFTTACGGDEASPATPTNATAAGTAVTATIPPAISTVPAPTTTPVPPSAGVTPAFREFARTLAAPLSQKDSSFFRARILTKHVVCTAEEAAQRGIDGCERVGQEFDGIHLSLWRSDQAGRVPVDTAIALIERLWSEAIPGATDQFGDSSARVYALSGPDLPRDADAPTVYVAVFTAIHNQVVGGGGLTAPRRASVITYWEMLNGQWRLTGLMNAFGLGQDFIEPTQEGRDALGDWERFQP